MKTKIKKYFLFSVIILAGILASVNLRAQQTHGPSRLGEPLSEGEWQVRLYALQLCKDFYAAALSEDFASKLDSYIASIEVKADGLPAYVPGAVENFVFANRSSSELAQRYIKCQGIIAFPDAFNMSTQALTDIQAELDAIALEISEIK